MYFLDEPSDFVLRKIVKIARNKGLKIYAIPHKFGKYAKYPEINLRLIGPAEFPSIIANASCIYTDSFHGTAFSVNLNRPFWTLQRNYKSFKSQSSRITDFLDLVNLSDQYVTQENQSSLELPGLDFENANKILNKQRKISRKYLSDAFKKCSKY